MAVSLSAAGGGSSQKVRGKRVIPKAVQMTDAERRLRGLAPTTFGRTGTVGGPTPANTGMPYTGVGPYEPVYTMAAGNAPGAATTSTTPQAATATGSYPTGMGTDVPQTAFGRTIGAGEYGNAIADPQALVTQYYKHNDLSQLGGGYANDLDRAQKLGLLYLLSNDCPTMGKYGYAGQVDWTGKFLDQQARPGGAAVGPQDVAGAMFNAEKGSPVWNALYGTVQNPQEQVDNWLNTLSSGLQGTMAEPVYQALMARYQQAGRDFAAQRLTNPHGATSFGEFLDKQGLGAAVYGV